MGKLTIMGLYPLVNLQKAIEAMAIEIVDFPMKNKVIVHGNM